VTDLRSSDAPARLKVLYIAGFERSGSTVFAKVLGESGGLFAAGELNNLWKRLYVDDVPCGCSLPFNECPVWVEVMSATIGTSDTASSQPALARQGGKSLLPLMFIPGGRKIAASRNADNLATLDRLYRSIQEVTGCNVIVDSSKGPGYKFLIDLLPDIDLYVVNLVRDPRGVQYSMLRRKRDGAPGYRNHSVTRSSLSWMGRNLLHEWLSLRSRRRYLSMRYEEFVADPLTSVQQVLRLIGEPTEHAPAIEDQSLDAGVNHMMGGSRNRRETGRVTLRHDDAWTSQLDERTTKRVTWLTYPLLKLYGFPTQLRHRRQNDATVPTDGGSA
jgi:hypothetical protein